MTRVTVTVHSVPVAGPLGVGDAVGVGVGVFVGVEVEVSTVVRVGVWVRVSVELVVWGVLGWSTLDCSVSDESVADCVCDVDAGSSAAASVVEEGIDASVSVVVVLLSSSSDERSSSHNVTVIETLPPPWLRIASWSGTSVVSDFCTTRISERYTSVSSNAMVKYGSGSPVRSALDSLVSAVIESVKSSKEPSSVRIAFVVSIEK
ncbi:hypothetical protein [Halogranum rubrum]|uniref:hypothetical protein n=1 Tax=Halogranum rubrum TaxID=553466 RepID=UPI00187277BC|nr:hypothetical protein [Halogranum salarium]